MPNPKPPRWLTSGFARGVDERRPPGGVRLRPAYRGAYPNCFLARHDERRRPCVGPIERFHFINRQRVETAMGEQLRGATILRVCERCEGSGLVGEGLVIGDLCPSCHGSPKWQGELTRAELWELVLLAAWDPRNAEYGCEGHHRRFDSHLTPALTVPYSALPASVVEFAFGQGIDGELNRFPSSI